MMNMSETKLKGLSYDANGGYQYNLLYLLLDGHWNKQLAEMPEQLRLRVKYAVPEWDSINNLASSVHYRGIPTTRQQLVKKYDIKFDFTQEQLTYETLSKYLQVELPGKIKKALGEGLASVVVLLRHKVEVPLNKIRSEEGIHWPNEYPLLWKALYLFEKSLIGMRDRALKGDDSNLIIALDDVLVDIYKILGIERCRSERIVVSACEAVEHAAPDTSLLTNNKTNDATPGKIPRNAIGKLAIKAAWQIECETKRHVFVDEVIEMLQSWVEHEEVLLEKIKNGVKWQTGGFKPKDFEVEACSKALERWHKSRH